MFELGLAIGIVAALVGIAMAATYAPTGTLIAIGTALAMGGLAVSVPIGIFYHLALFRATKVTGKLPRYWWLSPSSQHVLIPSAMRPGVLRWFYLGVVVVGLSLFGCFLILLAGLALWRAIS